MKYELRIMNYELRITNYELRITRSALCDASLAKNYELRITKYDEEYIYIWTAGLGLYDGGLLE